MVGFTEEELEIIEGTEIDIDTLSTLPKKHQQQILHVLGTLNVALDIMRENEEEGLNATQIREILNYLRQAKRDAEKYGKGAVKTPLKKNYVQLKETIEDRIEQMQDLHQEAIAYESQPKPPEKGFFEEFFQTIGSWVKIGLIITLILLIAFLLLAPTYLFPIVGKCVVNEGYWECYGRITGEKQLIEDFTRCQDGCGRGVGNEICLEKCEYTYRQGKYSVPNSYTTSSGITFECPLGTKGFVDSQGNPRCGVD